MKCLPEVVLLFRPTAPGRRPGGAGNGEALFVEVSKGCHRVKKEEFLHFCMGVNGMRITYDPHV